MKPRRLHHACTTATCGLLTLAGLGPISAQEGVTSISGTVRVSDGLAWPAVVYVPATGATPAAHDTAVIDQHRLAYVPAVLLVTPGTPVEFRNSDPVVHNVFSPTKATGSFDLGRYGPSDSRVHTFPLAGGALVLCRIHPEMFAHILVADATVWTVTDREGRFRLSGVPPGTTELVIWHPREGSRRVPLRPDSSAPVLITLPPR